MNTFNKLTLNFMSGIRDFHKQKLSLQVFTKDIQSNIESTFKNFYGIKDVKFKLLNYGMGIEMHGSNSFSFLKSALIKLARVPSETITVLSEDEENLIAFYAYLPEKDKFFKKKVKSLQN